MTGRIFIVIMEILAVPLGALCIWYAAHGQLGWAFETGGVMGFNRGVAESLAYDGER